MGSNGWGRCERSEGGVDVVWVGYGLVWVGCERSEWVT